MSVSGRSSKLDSHTPALSHAPPPPADLGFAPNFRPKRCVRCGVWSTQASPYNQEQSPERSWGQLVAWEAGSLLNPLGRHCLLCRKVAEIGGWLVTYGTINHMDKELDKDASASHSFLDQRSKLVEIKVGNPSARILSAADLSNEEKVTVKETKKTGLKAPKKSFMTLRAFRKRYPNKVIDPNSIKREYIDGDWKEGVDIILSEDEGVYEYINETTTQCDRTNNLTSSTVLSADQNDRIHNAALKNLGKMGGDDSNAVVVSGASSSRFGPAPADGSEVDPAEGRTGDVDMGDQDEQEDSHMLDPSPFSKLFSRMRGSAGNQQQKRPGCKATAQPKGEPNKKKSRNGAGGAGGPGGGGGANRNRKRGQGQGEESNVADEDFGSKAPVPTGDEDSTLIASYQSQLDDLQQLDADGSADGTFLPWCRSRMSKLTELKQGLQAKRKSLNRRKSECDDLVSSLDHLIAQVNITHDFLKKMSTGVSEGRQVYDMLIEMVGTEREDAKIKVSAAIWQRALKAVAFEDIHADLQLDLRLAQWEVFFDDTYAKCQAHLGAAGHNYFALLASQLSQRLVKSIGGGLKPGTEHTKILAKFVSVMFSRLQTITADGSGAENTDGAEYRAVRAAKVILDLKSPPSAVMEAKDVFDSKSPNHVDHWLVNAMILDRGKKVLDAAVANAKSREMQAGVLDIISEGIEKLEKADLLSEAVFEKGDDVARSLFTAEYGKMVGTIEKVLHEPGTKALKGQDRECANDLSTRLTSAAAVAVQACIRYDLIPFHELLLKSLKDGKESDVVPIPSEPLKPEACILYMQAAVQQKVMTAIMDFCNFMPDFAGKVADARKDDGLPASEAQDALTQWEKVSGALVTALKDARREADGPFSELAEAATRVSEQVRTVLQGQVHKDLDIRVSTCVDCVQTVTEQILPEDTTPIPFSKERVAEFDEDLQKARLLTSVIPDGACIRDGLLVIEAIVGFFIAWCPDPKKKTTASTHPEKLRKQDFHVLSLFTGFVLEDEDARVQSKKVMKMMEKVSYVGKRKLNMEAFENDTLLIYLDTLKEVKSVLSDIKDSFGEELDLACSQCGDVSLPKELANVSTLGDVTKQSELIQQVFSLNKSTQVSNCAVALEKWLARAKSTGKKLKIEPSEICDMAGGNSTWRSCLLWMTVGNLCSILCSKAVTRATSAKAPLGDKVVTPLKEAMGLASEHTLEIPAGLQAVATQLIQK